MSDADMLAEDLAARIRAALREQPVSDINVVIVRGTGGWPKAYATAKAKQGGYRVTVTVEIGQ